MDPDKVYKDRVGMNLAKRLNDAFIAKKVTRDEAREIANFILENMEQIKTSAQVLKFLEGLSEKWPIFKDFLILEQGDIQNKEIEEKEEIAVQQASTLLKSNNIDEALKVAENANNSGGRPN